MKAKDIKADGTTRYRLHGVGLLNVIATLTGPFTIADTRQKCWMARSVETEKEFQVTSREVIETAEAYQARFKQVNEDSDRLAAEEDAKHEAAIAANHRITATLDALGIDRRGMYYQAMRESLHVTPVHLDAILQDIINKTAAATREAVAEKILAMRMASTGSTNSGAYNGALEGAVDVIRAERQ